MRILLPVHDYDYKEGLESGTINGGTIWLDNIAHALRDAGHEAELISLNDSWEADAIIIQSEWTGVPSYLEFKGKKVILLGHFIGGVYPDPRATNADHLITMWKGELLDGFKNVHYIPHAYSDLTDKGNVINRGDIIWAGNPYKLRKLDWLDGLPLSSVSGILPHDLLAMYRGANVCPNIHGGFQLGEVSDDPSRIADKPGYMINERFWNVIGCGGVLVTDYNPQILDYFKEDEIIMCKTKEEFHDKVHYYNKHKEEGIRFYGRARERIRKEHTYKERVREILNIIQ